MADFERDANGDIATPVVLVDDPAADAQAALLLTRGELVWNLLIGIPWFANDSVSEAEAIVGGKLANAARRASVRRVLSEMILAVPGIAKITDMTIELIGRELQVNWDGLDTEGRVVTGTEVVPV